MVDFRAQRIGGEGEREDEQRERNRGEDEDGRENQFVSEENLEGVEDDLERGETEGKKIAHFGNLRLFLLNWDPPPASVTGNR